MPDDIDSTIINIIADTKRLDASNIGPDTPLDSLGIESLDIVVILHEIEDRWKLTVPDDVLENLGTVQDVVDAVTTAVNG